MWSYFGSKSSIVNSYPYPEHNKIIEPFAGTAKYSLKYFDREIILIDKYDVIIKIWKWLQLCSPKDILGLPILKEDDHVDSFNFDCIEAKWLVGFTISAATTTPRKTAQKWKTTLRPNTQNYRYTFIANNLYKIKHWDIRLGDYTDILNQKATWFIDAPYQYGGQEYKIGSNKLDYSDLKKYILERDGQAIVCENDRADWFDFSPLIKLQGIKKTSFETIYYQVDGKKIEYSNSGQKNFYD